MTHSEQCPFCEAGWIDHSDETCTHCGGTGIVERVCDLCGQVRDEALCGLCGDSRLAKAHPDAEPVLESPVGTIRIIRERDEAVALIRALPSRCTAVSDLGDQGELRSHLERFRDSMLDSLGLGDSK